MPDQLSGMVKEDGASLWRTAGLPWSPRRRLLELPPALKTAGRFGLTQLVVSCGLILAAWWWVAVWLTCCISQVHVQISSLPVTCCGGTFVQDPLKMQGCITCCFPFCKEALNLIPSQDHVKTRMPLYQHSVCNLVRASHIPRSLLFNGTMCYKLRIWGGMKAASPSIHPHTKLHGAATAYNNNNNKKRGARKHLGLFLLVTTGALFKMSALL